MDTEKDYKVLEEIVQCGQSAHDWDNLRNGKGDWPEDRKVWKPYREYSFDKLSEMMKEYKTAVPTATPHRSWLAERLSDSKIDGDLIELCDAKLVKNEGFSLESDFAAADIDLTYLESIGIVAKGLQQRLMALHKDAVAQYAKPEGILILSIQHHWHSF